MHSGARQSRADSTEELQTDLKLRRRHTFLSRSNAMSVLAMPLGSQPRTAASTIKVLRDRKSVVQGKSEDPGGRRIIKKKKNSWGLRSRQVNGYGRRCCAAA